MSAAQPVVDRPLSALERWYWICDRIAPLNVIARARLHGPAPIPALRTALDALQQRHPLLRVAIATDESGENPRFAPREGIPIPLREVSAPDADWERELNEHEFNVAVDWRTGPLIRTAVLHRPGGDHHDLILTVPHCIADGTTVLTLLRQWIELAAAPDTPVVSLRALPAPEDLLPQRASAPATSDSEAVAPGSGAAAKPQRIEATRLVPFENRRTRVVHRTIGEADLAVLAEACRRERTTVHGVLAAAMVVAVAEDAGATGDFVIGSPLDVRADLAPPVSPDEVGTYVATLPTVVTHRPDSPLWTSARVVSEDLAARRQRGEALAAIGGLRGVAPTTLADSGEFLRFMDAEGPIKFCLSNLGRVAFPEEIGPWRISGAQFVSSLSVNGLFVATANTCHGRLAWNFAYVDQAVPQERALRLADRAFDLVQALITASA